MKKPYLYKQDLILPIYRGHFVTILTNDVKKLKNQVDFEGSSVYAHTLYQQWKAKSEGFIIVLNFDNPYRPIYPGVISHEASHAAHMILENRGVIPDFTNDEPVAYLVEWITDQVYYFVNKKGFKVSPP